MKQLEKIAFDPISQGIGAAIGHHVGKQNAKEGKKQRFGGLQAASLLLPGGAGYQAGKHIGYKNQKAGKKTDTSKAKEE